MTDNKAALDALEKISEFIGDGCVARFGGKPVCGSDVELIRQSLTTPPAPVLPYELREAVEEYNGLINGTNLRPVIMLCFEDAPQLRLSEKSSETIIRAALQSPAVPREVIETEFIETCQKSFIFSNVKAIIRLIKREYPDGIKIKGEA